MTNNDPMPLSAVVEEADAIVRRLFPDEEQRPRGLKLELVRSIRKAELRGYQACMRDNHLDESDQPAPA